MKTPIVFAINESYYKQLETVIVSILENSSSNFEFIVLSKGLPEFCKDAIGKTISLYGDRSSARFIDLSKVKNINIESLMSRRDDYCYISVETFYRFYIPSLLPEYDKVIYLDADILVFDDLQNLYKIDVDQVYVGAVKDTYVTSIVGQNKKSETRPKISFRDYLATVLNVKHTQYFNAGVLLLNLKKIRRDNIEPKLWNFAIDRSPLDFQDQDVLNAVLGNKVKLIPPRWNLYKDYTHKTINRSDCQTTPGIVHFAGREKPWNTKNPSYRHLIDWLDAYKKIFSCEPQFEDKLSRIKSLIKRYKGETLLSYQASANADGIFLLKQKSLKNHKNDKNKSFNHLIFKSFPMEQLSFTDLEIEIRKVGGYGLKLTNPCPAESKKARKFGLFYWKIMSVYCAIYVLNHRRRETHVPVRNPDQNAHCPREALKWHDVRRAPSIPI